MQIAHLLAVSIAPFATISELTRWFADVFYFWHVGSLILEFNKFDTLVHSVLKAWFVLLPLKQWRRAGIRRVSKKIHSENDGSVDCGWKYPYQFCCQKITKNWQKTGFDDFEKSQLFSRRFCRDVDDATHHKWSVRCVPAVGNFEGLKSFCWCGVNFEFWVRRRREIWRVGIIFDTAAEFLKGCNRFKITVGWNFGDM